MVKFFMIRKKNMKNKLNNETMSQNFTTTYKCCHWVVNNLARNKVRWKKTLQKDKEPCFIKVTLIFRYFDMTWVTLLRCAMQD